LAREHDSIMTGYVSTRYYRAPEIMLNWQKYGCAIDIWSVGCILVEMIEGRILFPGKDYVDQFGLIVELLGTPSDAIIDTIQNRPTIEFLKLLPQREPIEFRERFKYLDRPGKY